MSPSRDKDSPPAKATQQLLFSQWTPPHCACHCQMPHLLCNVCCDMSAGVCSAASCAQQSHCQAAAKAELRQPQPHWKAAAGSSHRTHYTITIILSASTTRCCRLNKNNQILCVMANRAASRLISELQHGPHITLLPPQYACTDLDMLSPQCQQNTTHNTIVHHAACTDTQQAAHQACPTDCVQCCIICCMQAGRLVQARHHVTSRCLSRGSTAL